jgi:hypothetical protein
MNSGMLALKIIALVVEPIILALLKTDQKIIK